MIEWLNNNNNRNKGKDLLENEVRMALHLIELQGEKEEESILGSWQGTDVWFERIQAEAFANMWEGCREINKKPG